MVLELLTDLKLLVQALRSRSESCWHGKESATEAQTAALPEGPVRGFREPRALLRTKQQLWQQPNLHGKKTVRVETVCSRPRAEDKGTGYRESKKLPEALGSGNPTGVFSKAEHVRQIDQITAYGTTLTGFFCTLLLVDEELICLQTPTVSGRLEGTVRTVLVQCFAVPVTVLVELVQS